MPESNNELTTSALRLHNVLSRLSGIKKGTYAQAITQAAEISGNIFYIMHLLNKLYGQMRSDLEQADPDAIVEHRDELFNISALLNNINMSEPAEHVTSKFLDPSVLTALKSFNRAIKKGNALAEACISNDDLDKIRAEAASLSKTIFDSNIDNLTLKSILTDLTASVINAIDQYKLLGADGLRKACEQIIGAFVVQHKLFTSNAQSIDYEKYIRLAISISDLVEKAKPWIKVIEGSYIQRFLA